MILKHTKCISVGHICFLTYFKYLILDIWFFRKVDLKIECEEFAEEWNYQSYKEDFYIYIPVF